MNLGGRPNPPSIVDEGGSDDETQDEEAHTFDISGKSLQKSGYQSTQQTINQTSEIKFPSTKPLQLGK